MVGIAREKGTQTIQRILAVVTAGLLGVALWAVPAAGHPQPVTTNTVVTVPPQPVYHQHEPVGGQTWIVSAEALDSADLAFGNIEVDVKFYRLNGFDTCRGPQTGSARLILNANNGGFDEAELTINQQTGCVEFTPRGRLFDRVAVTSFHGVPSRR